MALGVRLKATAKRRVSVKGNGSGGAFADRNKSKKREDSKRQTDARGGNRQSRVNSRIDGNNDVSRTTTRGKRNKNDALQVYEDERTARRNANAFRKGSSHPVEGKLGHTKNFARKGDKLKFVDSDEDDLCPEGRNRQKISKDKVRVKGRKSDQSAKLGQQKVDAKDASVEENGECKEKSDRVAEEKHLKFPTRVLDKTGKKIRVSKKHLDGGSEEASPSKKRKWGMKIDPYDLSNKRLDDTPLNANGPKKIPKQIPEAETEISINAKFRAIQPSSSILSFVEENLLGRRRLNELQNAGYNVKLSAPLDNVPFSSSTERERIEENVFRNKLEFFAAAKISSSFPPPSIPEVAFAGISNVGKSSLLNALTRQWGVVRTSDKPGLTQTINFFQLASKLCLVDLPGYGFAYAKDEVKESWQELVKEYVSTRDGLQRVCLLIHTKRGMKPWDHELIDLMERSRTPYQIVLTKTDLVFPIDVARRAMEIQENLKNKKSVVNPVMMVSSKTGAGIRNLRTVLAKLSRFIKP